MMQRIERFLGRSGVPPWILLLSVAAILFLIGSGSFAGAGAHDAAQFGILGASVAVAVIIAFVRR
jgi:hypothetical protein